jgi:hypothetical protein
MKSITDALSESLPYFCFGMRHAALNSFMDSARINGVDPGDGLCLKFWDSREIIWSLESEVASRCVLPGQ